VFGLASDEWISIYKFARMAFLAACLLGIALYVYHPSRRERLERPAQRMLEEDDA
jgi:cbb3-type cytochrome oxidase subunit 3